MRMFWKRTGPKESFFLFVCFILDTSTFSYMTQYSGGGNWTKETL